MSDEQPSGERPNEAPSGLRTAGSPRPPDPSGVAVDPPALAAPPAAGQGERRPPARASLRSGGPLGIPVTAPAVALMVLMTALFLMFLLIEPTPRWMVLFGAGAAALSMDGILRRARREPFESGADTTPYLFLPALFVLAAPVFIEHNVRGYWMPAAAVGAGLAFGAVIVAEIASVREHDPVHAAGRFVAAAATYFVAFALFSLTYTFDLDLRPAIVAMVLVSVLLAVEILREGEVDPLETLIFAVVTGLVVGELRWTLHFLPIDGHLGGLTLLLGFYFVTGLLHSHLTRHLDALVAVEYVMVVMVGIALVAGARAAGIA